MSESEKENVSKTNLIAKAMESVAHSPLGYLIGMALVYLAIIAIPRVADKWDGHLQDQTGCVKLQKIDKIIYKVNSCSGEVSKLENSLDK